MPPDDVNPQVLVRPAIPQDADSARLCVEAAFERYIERIGRPPAPMLLDFPAAIAAQQVWVADLDGEVVGVLVIYPTDEGFYIDTVAVSPPLQGSGIGKTLLQFAERQALHRGYNSIYLCTHVKMTENQRLYPKIGYVETERKVDQGFARVFYRKRLVDP